MKKKILNGMVFILLVMSPFSVYCEGLDINSEPIIEETNISEPAIEETNIPKTVALTLEEAKIYAINHNLDIEIAYLTLEAKDDGVKKAKHIDKSLKDADKAISAASTNYQYLLGTVQGIYGTDIKAFSDLSSEQVETLKSADLALYGGVKYFYENPSVIDDADKKLYDNVEILSKELKNMGLTNTSDFGYYSGPGTLMRKGAEIIRDIAKAGVLIQKQGVELKVANGYYTVLEKEKLLGTKQSALELAESIRGISKESYELGLASKHDYLMAVLQAKAKSVEVIQSENEYKAAMIDLKALLNMDYDQEIVLADDFLKASMEINLQEDIKNGLNNRIEILKTRGEYIISDLNFQLIKKKMTSNTYDYIEAENVRNEKMLFWLNQSNEVEASIRKSYDNIMAAKAAVAVIDGMIGIANESYEISKFKFETGFNSDSALMNSMNAESLTGTVAEVLAAQEKLRETEEANVQAIYTYNLAMEKYKYDIGEY